MIYPGAVQGRFLSRPNRFVAQVELEGRVETVHVKNTGRCRELLLPGAAVGLAPAANPARKTRWDLVSVDKPGRGWVNLDSQAPNQLVKRWLETQGWDRVRPEFAYGSSRIDFAMEKEGRTHLLEVKGCTLEVEGVGYFPDAPTQRGVRHLRELTAARQAGLHSAVAFVVQMEGVTQVRPNRATHPAFGDAWDEARAVGVEFLFLLCRTGPDRLELDRVVRPED